MAKKIPIGEAARLSGMKVPTIHYYEQIGDFCLRRHAQKTTAAVMTRATCGGSRHRSKEVLL
jgi:hypothetical protein